VAASGSEGAWSLRWRAPELALVLGERAGAETAVVFASCRLGQKLAVVERAIAALREAERLGDADSAAVLRLELAGCARSVGVPLVGAALVAPLLTGSGTPTHRAAALVRLVGCLAYRAQPRMLDAALARADQLYVEDGGVGGGSDTVVLLRALLRSAAAAEHRRRGDARSAVDAAREGAELLRGLESDGGYVRSRLAAQLALGLLDLGRVDDARLVADALHAEPTRGAAAGPSGWLAVALAARVYLPAGLLAPAMAVLRDAVALGARHRLDALHAESLSLLADASERAGQLSEAIGLLRTGHGVRMRQVRAEQAARGRLLGAFGMPDRPDELIRLLASFAPAAAARPRRAEPVSAPGVDVSMLLVDVEPRPRHGAALDRVANHVRHAAPADATVARLGGADLAVLLPGVPGGHARRWAERLEDAMVGAEAGVRVNVRTPDQKPTGRHAPDNITTTTIPAVVDPPPALPPPALPPPAPPPPAPPRREEARSVLARLGVEVRGSGGRRRAEDAPVESPPANGSGPRQPIVLPSMDWLSELRLAPREADPVLPPAPPALPAAPLFQFEPEPPRAAPEAAPPTPEPPTGGKHSNRLGDLLMEALLAYRTASEPENPRPAGVGRELADDRDTAPRWRLPPWD
jgi:hypothetical protein